MSMPSSTRSVTDRSHKPISTTPVSERQQMALLLQMTADNSPAEAENSPGNRQKGQVNDRGETPLHIAAIKCDKEAVNQLLSEGVDPNCADFAGWTPLHEACNRGWYDIAEVLLKAGANPNARGLNDDTPLHDAAVNGHFELVRLLLDHGADVNQTNRKGKKAEDVALSIYVKKHLRSKSREMSGSSSDQADQPDTSHQTDSTTPTRNSGASYEMRRSLHSKTEKSPRVTLRFCQLKRDDKKDRSKTANQVLDSSAESAKSTMDPSESGGNKEESEKEVNSNGVGEDKAASNETDSAPSGVSDSATPQTVENEDIKRTHPTTAEEDEDVKKKKARKEEPTPTTPRSKSGSTSGGSPKSVTGAESDGEGPKVPPLKIVIPPREQEGETGTGRNGNSGLPYIVASNEEPPAPPCTPPPPTEESTLSEEQQKSQRVLRSSHSSRSNGGSSGSSPAAADTASPQPTELDPPPEAVEPPQAPAVDLHPRKRKLKSSREVSESTEPAISSSPVHPHDQPITNCYQLFLNIRKQIDRRRKRLFPVQPKPPHGFKDYLMNRCTYVLAGNTSVTPNQPPSSLPPAIKDFFIEQEKDRYRLRMQHITEKEKLVLSVEQEILRVHGRAARALANQSLPFSACTILKDEEVYNFITPEQEEKDRNARSRYNGRLFLSWLQDVDDKWEKIKEGMLLRHHKEAQSLHAVQKMDWEWKMKELGLCEFKAKPVIEDSHVPNVHVSDDFDLLPA